MEARQGSPGPVSPHITLPQGFWEFICRERKADTPKRVALARIYIRWAVEHYSPEAFWCDLHSSYLAHTTAALTKRDLTALQKEKVPFLSECLGGIEVIGDEETVLRSMLHGDHCGDAKTMGDFITSIDAHSEAEAILSTRRLAERANTSAAPQHECRIFDSGLGSVEAMDFLVKEQVEELLESCHRMHRARLKATISQSVEAFILSKFNACCRARKRFFPHMGALT